MTPKEINDMKRKHNVYMERGQQLYAEMMDLHEKCLDLRNKLKKAEGDEYDPIPLIFGGGFWIDPDL